MNYHNGPSETASYTGDFQYTIAGSSADITARGSWQYRDPAAGAVVCDGIGFVLVTVEEEFTGDLRPFPAHQFHVAGTDLDRYSIPQSFFVTAPSVSWETSQTSTWACGGDTATVTRATGFPIGAPQALPDGPWSTLQYGATVAPNYDITATVTSPDSDGDGIVDAAEITDAGTDLYPTFADDPDSDDDCLDDGDEIWIHRTNPRSPDSDGDAHDDGAEVAAGTDPNDSGSGAQGSTPCDGTIVIEKQTEPDGSEQEFEFIGALAGTITDGGSLSQTVAPGTYTVTEVSHAGWEPLSVTCDDSDSSGAIVDGHAVATFTVAAGEVATCVVRNQRVNQQPTAIDDLAEIPRGIGSRSRTVSVLANDMDPDGDTITVTAPSRLLTLYGVVTCSANSCTYTMDKKLGPPMIENPGPDAAIYWLDSFSYSITDGRGGFDQATVNIRIYVPHCEPPCGNKG